MTLRILRVLRNALVSVATGLLIMAIVGVALWLLVLCIEYILVILGIWAVYSLGHDFAKSQRWVR